jgi:hypothetical protein
MSALLLAGCTSQCNASQAGVSTNGELSNGRFTYSCASPGDPICTTGDTQPSFPDCIVLGGRFQLSYQLIDESARSDDNTLSNIAVRPGNEDFFSNWGSDAFVAERVGRSVMLAVENDQVLDLLHMSIQAPLGIGLVDISGVPVSNIEVEVGDQAIAFVDPDLGTRCYEPGGAASLTVTGGDSDVARARGGDVVEITGVDVGETSFSVSWGGVSTDLHIVVVPATDDPTSGSTGDTSTEADTDTSTDTDAGGTSDTDSSTATSGLTDGSSTTDGSTGTDGSSGTSGGSDATGANFSRTLVWD